MKVDSIAYILMTNINMRHIKSIVNLECSYEVPKISPNIFSNTHIDDKKLIKNPIIGAWFMIKIYIYGRTNIPILE